MVILQETDKQRINEIKLYIIASNFYSAKGNQTFLINFIGDMTKYIDFAPGPVIDLAREILSGRYTPTKKELAMLLLADGEKTTFIMQTLHIASNTLTTFRKNEYVLYPRGSKHYYPDLEKFIKGYDQLFKIDYNNIIIKKD